MNRLASFNIGLVIALGAVACSGTTDPMASDRVALTRATSQWNAAGVHDYNYDLVTSFGAAHDSVQVQVRADQVTLSKSYVSGQISPAGETIPGLLAAVDDAITSGLKVHITYDPQLGYPAAGTVASRINTPAGPSSWKISNFARVP